MSYTTTRHPTEEALCNCALNECDDKLREHIDRCPQCSTFVKEIRSLSHDIASIEDEPVPERLNAAVLAITRFKGKQHITAILTTWYISPLFLGMMALGMILLLYVELVLMM